jgi:hypothetical protein
MAFAHGADKGDGEFTDPLGTIVIQRSETGAERVLQLRSDLVSAGAFEFAVRERVARLATLRHPMLLPVRRIDRESGRPPRVSVVSDYPTAVPLRQLVNSARPLTPFSLGWAIGAIRAVLEGVAALHTVGLDVAHGLITPDRVFVDRDGRVSIADYVFGTALQQLRYTADRYAREFAIQMPPGTVLFDQRLDVYQIGVVASALLQSASPGAAPLEDPLRDWLSRVTHASFASTREALNALLTIEVPSGPGPSLTDAMIAAPPEPVPPGEPVVSIDLHSAKLGTELVCCDVAAEPFIDPKPETCHVEIELSAQNTVPSASHAIATVAYIPSSPAHELQPVQPKSSTSHFRDVSPAHRALTRSRSTAIPITVAVLSAVLVVTLIARARAGSSAAPIKTLEPSPSPPVPLSQLVDATSPVGLGTATVAAAAPARSVPAKPEPAKTAIEPVPPKVTAARIGWIELRSSIDAQVVEDDRVITATGWSRAEASEGRHNVTIVNSAIGVREFRTIAIAAGRTSVVTFDPPHGALSVNAVPWAEVSLDGRPIGATPLGNIIATVGSHELVFRHPTYGEQRRTVMVSPEGTARMSVNFTKDAP